MRIQANLINTMSRTKTPRFRQKRSDTQIGIKEIHKAVSVSSKIEGMSFFRAKKNKIAISKLKRYGRAFSL